MLTYLIFPQFLDEDVQNILETRILLESKEKTQPLTVKVNYIDIRLSFSKIDKLGYTVEIAKYYADGNASLLSAPEQTIELLPPVKEVILSDQKPHQLLRVTLKNARENEEDGEIYFSTVHAANIFTGSVYRMGVANFSGSSSERDTRFDLRKFEKKNSSSKYTNSRSESNSIHRSTCT